MFVRRVLGWFSAVLGGRGTKSLLGRCRQVLGGSWQILGVFAASFRFGWRWTQFLEVLEGLRQPEWSQDCQKVATGTPGKLQKQ